MSRYHRMYENGGCYAFSVVTYRRKKILSDINNISLLMRAFEHIQNKRPFFIDALVILPDHLHCIWQLPEGDCDFSTRWRLIKHYFSSKIQAEVNNRKEKKIWQRRYWEHLIRNHEDWKNQIDYIHQNPVKHRYVRNPGDWKYSSYNYWREEGLYA